MTTERESMFPDQSDFEYDYETLRTTGVIIGVILFVSGILIALTLIQQAPRYQRQRVSSLCLLKRYRRSVYGGMVDSSWEVYQREAECVQTHTLTNVFKIDTHLCPLEHHLWCTLRPSWPEE
ncbi:FXYD domain containing ion transport regulator 7 isoform X1 [Esox lucius]|uniref:FXYD domain-containing ion transport regulator n=1 Tax=Esox lucius TaxID=8010 RepID=A0A6Q2XCB1_ESOLU|nr:FXYD domain containing ion transport regulator 7 isoform X1 [Esox lucius]XP_019896870.2 FXYD domain containing ion transport regulator 7 isoform X1 [Esox lucius]